MTTDTHTLLIEQLTYSQWANGRLIEVLSKLDAPPPAALRLIAHIAAAESVWIQRIQGGTSPEPLWPAMPINECVDRFLINSTQLQQLVDDDSLHETVRYQNSRGELFENTVGEILSQLYFHGIHHRGQISAALRAAGIEPPPLDFIFAVRNGLIARAAASHPKQ